MEVTFRTDAAQEAIRNMAQGCPDILVGAGTVLCEEQVDRAVEAGARFIVSPGFNRRVVEYCQKKDILIIPGCAMPSDVEAALEMGISTVKFFPAEALGGVASIKALSGPYPSVRFVPTGGINRENLNDYLKFQRVLACGGSWMIKKDWLRAERFDLVEAAAREAICTMLGFELRHVGINCSGEEEVKETAAAFSHLFGFEQKEGKSSVFSGSGIEIMKGTGRGKRGHLAIGTNHMERAMDYLKRQGCSFDETSAKYKDGKLTAIYLQDEIGSFAVHPLQK